MPVHEGGCYHMDKSLFKIKALARYGVWTEALVWSRNSYQYNDYIYAIGTGYDSVKIDPIDCEYYEWRKAQTLQVREQK